ncbi:MAG: hypothetical protein ACI4C7_03620 [Clostridia bacterium]
MNILSKNLELRCISRNKKANGETDFKGETSTLTTEERVEFLNEYARQLPKMFDDFSLDKPVVTLEEAKKRFKKIKPQPAPKTRRRIDLDDWKWIGFNENKEKSPAKNNMKIPVQDFRCFMEWELTENADYSHCVFALGNAAQMKIDGDGQSYYISNKAKNYISKKIHIRKIKFELDFIYRKWNLYLNDELMADFVDFSNPDTDSVSEFTSPYAKSMIKRIWGVGYHRLTESDFEPYSIKTFIDEDFSKPIDINGWNTADYKDTSWESGTLPIVHGGERYAMQDIYMRKKVCIDEVPPYAELYIESIIPGGEVYINECLVAFIKDPSYKKIDVTEYLKQGENLIAIKVYSDKIKECDKMTHTNADLYTGWFAARMHLDLLTPIYIDDVFVWTESIKDNKAIEKIKVSVNTQMGLASAKAVPHKLSAKIVPWFPDEGEVSAVSEWTTPATPNIMDITENALEIENPMLWTANKPQLYKIIIELKDLSGKVIDDYVITTGIRTVSQEGGIFRINGKPELLRAPLLFGSRPPLDKIAVWDKCPPAEFYVQEMLMVKGMNGNGLRMSVHDERIGGINDPRICEIADQLGIMLIWQTNAWLRITSATNINLDMLETDIKQVRNHASIVIWQPSNHPSWRDWDTAMRVYRMLHSTIIGLDKSRLISPSADVRRMRARYDDGLTDFWGNPCEDCDPIWTADLICRGNMDYILGYGNEWSALREWPDVKEEHLPNWAESTGYVKGYLDSKERAYFNFEHDEITGQPNWDLYKGKPMYHIDSYEKDYDEGSIGRKLGFDEWLTSQAWQAFGAYQTIVKSRWLDYDGLCWCNLRGGQNTVTYQKSLVDYYGQAKLAYYAHRMAFQNVLACSGNVDVVYGPDDTIPLIVMNIGEEKTVNVKLKIISDNNILFTAEFKNIKLPAGRNSVNIDNVGLPDLDEGIYSIIYTVYTEEM